MEVIIKKIEAEVLNASGMEKAYIVHKYVITFFVYDLATELHGTMDWNKEIDIPEIEKRILQLFK